MTDVPGTVSEDGTTRDGYYGRAVWSVDRAYRWLLIRRWQFDLEPMTWVMLNPSCAGATDDDPTIRKCAGYAARWGFGGIRVVNLFGLVATDPAALRSHPDPVGEANDRHITRWLSPSTCVAWGASGTLRNRDVKVAGLLAAAGIHPFCIGVTKGTSREGPQPLHPGRTAYDLPQIPWRLV